MIKKNSKINHSVRKPKNRYPAIPSLGDECSWFSWIYILFPFQYDVAFSLRDTKTEGVPKLHESQSNIHHKI